MKLPFFFLSIVLPLVQISGARSLAYEFEVDGTMKASPSGYPPFSCSMQIYVRDCQWAVFQIWESPTNQILREISDDGDCVYALNHIETNAGNFSPDDDSRAFPNSWTGEIYPAHFPFGILNTEAIALFYAYASSCYLDAHPNQVIGSIRFQPRDTPRTYEGAHALITRSSPPLRLPSKIIFFPEFQYVTNAVLSTSEFTNIANVQVPLKVSLVRYFQNKTNILTTYEFQVTRISEKCALKSFKPRLPSGAYVTDYRVPHFLASDPGSLRKMTNGWPAMRTD
jgi:hypothetical protein